MGSRSVRRPLTPTAERSLWPAEVGEGQARCLPRLPGPRSSRHLTQSEERARSRKMCRSTIASGSGEVPRSVSNLSSPELRRDGLGAARRGDPRPAACFGKGGSRWIVSRPMESLPPAGRNPFGSHSHDRRPESEGPSQCRLIGLRHPVAVKLHSEVMSRKIVNAAGPTRTTKIPGKINRISGMSSVTAVLEARSSAFCRRL